MAERFTEASRRRLGRGLLATLVALALTGGCSSGESAVDRGRAVAEDVGCLSCHAEGGESGIGPGFAGLWGSERRMDDGTVEVFDEEYLYQAIIEPFASTVEGYLPVMPQIYLSDEELEDVLAYVREVSGG